MHKLAIVIPVYKKKYLRQSLESVFAQTDSRYNVYIGNDNSPEDIDAVVSSFSHHANLHYVKFANNLGAVSLVQQWERCLQLAGSEEWVWLFSDDDVMDTGCVKSFYETLQHSPLADVFRFNMKLIDAEGSITSKVLYPAGEYAADFLSSRLGYRYASAVTNYIFRKKTLLKNGLQDFPLAWCADDAMIISCTGSGVVQLIEGADVSWRLSDVNISAGHGDEKWKEQKLQARLQFLNWVLNFPGISVPELRMKLLRWYETAIMNDCPGASLDYKKEMMNKAVRASGTSNLQFAVYKTIIGWRGKIKLLFASLKRRL